MFTQRLLGANSLYLFSREVLTATALYMGKFLLLKSCADDMQLTCGWHADDAQMTEDLVRLHVDDILWMMSSTWHLHVICTSSTHHPHGYWVIYIYCPRGPQRLGMTSRTTYIISTSSACHLCGPQCGHHWHRSSTGCLHCPRCGPHWQRSSYIIPTCMQMLSTHHPHGPWVICTLSLWSPDWRWHWGPHICHQHIIHMSSSCSPHWQRSSTACSHCSRCGPHWQRSSTGCPYGPWCGPHWDRSFYIIQWVVCM